MLNFCVFLLQKYDFIYKITHLDLLSIPCAALKTYCVLPPYSNPKEIVGFYDFLFKSSPDVGGRFRRVGTPLKQEGTGCCENEFSKGLAFYKT